MSIILYAGLPGQGKSYSVVENVIVPALKAGRHVAHNLNLNDSVLGVLAERDIAGLLHQIPRDCTAEELIACCPPGCVIVVDEVWRYWPAGTKVNEVPKDQLSFFKEHRHRVGADGLASEIIIIDQDAKTAVPAWLRALIELTYIYTKHSALGSKTRYRCDVYSKCQSIEKPTKSAKLRSLQGKYDPRIFAAYVSHTQSKSVGEGAMEVMADSRANLLKTVLPWMVGAVVFFGIMLGLLSHVWDGMTHKNTPKAKTQTTAAAVPAKPPPPPVQVARVTPEAAPPTQTLAEPTAPPQPQGPQLSKRWRLLGFIKIGDGPSVAYLTSATAKRRIPADLCEASIKDDRRSATDGPRLLLGMDYRCLVDGEVVTSWTGEAPFASAQLPDGSLGGT